MKEIKSRCKLLFVLFIWIVNITSFARTDTIKKFQDRNLKKALYAIEKRDYEKAFVYLKDNLVKKRFHLESHMLLARIHADRGDTLKALSVYNYIIEKRKLEDTLKKIDFAKLINKTENNVAPSKEVLSILYRLGQIYHKMYVQKEINGKLAKVLIEKARLYFHMCDYYSYKKGKVNYFLGLINQIAGDDKKALNHLFKAQNILGKKNNIKTDKLIATINYFIARSLIKEDLGRESLVFFRSVYLSRNANPALKEYAKTYLSYLNPLNLYTISVSTGATYKNNTYGLNNNELDRFDINYRGSLKEKNAWFMQYGGNIYYTSPINDNYHYSLLFSGKDEKAFKKTMELNDNRTIVGGGNISFDNRKKTKLVLSYLYLQYFSKGLGVDELKTKLINHIVTPQYIHLSSVGSVSMKTPLSVSRGQSGKYLFEPTIGVAFKSLSYKYRFWNPLYSAEVTRQRESDLSTSMEYLVSFGNNINLNKSFKIYLASAFSINDGGVSENDYKDYSFEFDSNYSISYYKGLYFTITGEISEKRKRDGNIREWSIANLLSYSL